MVTDGHRVVDDADAQRYELRVGDDAAGFLAYHDHEDGRVLVHTEVDPAYEGLGLGSKLVAAALDDARASGLKVVPVCPFVTAYLRRHPEYADLLAP